MSKFINYLLTNALNVLISIFGIVIVK